MQVKHGYIIKKDLDSKTRNRIASIRESIRQLEASRRFLLEDLAELESLEKKSSSWGLFLLIFTSSIIALVVVGWLYGG